MNNATVPYQTHQLLGGGGTAADRVQIICSTFHLHVSEKAFRFARHQHPAHELIFADKGIYRCRLNGVEVKVRPSEVLIVAPGDWHEDFYVPRLRFYVAAISLSRIVEGREIRLSVFRNEAPVKNRVVKPPRSWIRSLLRNIAKESSAGDPWSRRVQDGILHELFWGLVRAIPAADIAPQLRESPADAGLARRLNDLFEAGLHRPLNVAAMAAALSLSESALAHQCTARLGMSPAKAFTRFRIDRAAQLLRSTEMSVKQVSAYLGFSNPYHFSRVFRSVCGFPPVRLVRHERAVQE